jgi:hypothetical protein
MDDIFSESLPSMDELSLHNIDKYASQIKIDENEEKIHCFYLDAISKKKILLAEIDSQTNVSKIYPIYTFEDSPNYLKSKYDLNEIVFEGYQTEISETANNMDGIYGLPKGFIKTLHYGLGLEKKYSVIIATIIKYNANF